MPTRPNPRLTWLAATLALVAVAHRATAQSEVTQGPVAASQGRMMFKVTEIHDPVGQPPRLAIRVATEKPYSRLLPMSFHVQVTGDSIESILTDRYARGEIAETTYRPCWTVLGVPSRFPVGIWGRVHLRASGDAARTPASRANRTYSVRWARPSLAKMRCL